MRVLKYMDFKVEISEYQFNVYKGNEQILINVPSHPKITENEIILFLKGFQAGVQFTADKINNQRMELYKYAL